MSAQQHCGWVVGMSLTAGIGAAVLLGGAGTAAADASSESRSSENRSSESRSSENRNAAVERPRRHHDRNRADRAVDRHALSSTRTPAADTTVEAEREVRKIDDTADQQVGVAPADETDGREPAPLDAVATTALGSSATRRLAEPESEPAPNSAPTLTTHVGTPDALTGVTSITAIGVDPDLDELSYTAGRARFGLVTGDGSGQFSYTPSDFSRLLARLMPFIRSDRFTVTVSDGRGGVTSSVVTTAIIPVNAAPRARPSTIDAPKAHTGIVTGRANAIDPNRDRLTFLASTIDTGQGTVVVRSDGRFTYTPTAEARHGAAATTASLLDRTVTFRVSVTDVFGAITEIPVTVPISPSNTAPTGTVLVDDPDATTGLVTGRVLGSDADGDSLTFSGPTGTARGTVAVDADGAFTYSPSEFARLLAASVYSTPALRSDTFEVTISDGHGGATIVTVNVAISPDTQSPATVPLSTFCGCTMMPVDSIYHADIRGLAALAESAGWIELLGGGRGATMHAGWGGSEWMGSTGGIPVNVVGPDHPTEMVIFNRGYSTSGPGIDNRPYAIPDRPLVEGMPSYPAWDRHLFVFQEGTCISQELINVANGVELPGAGILDILGNAVYRAIWGSTWIAQGGVQYDMNSALYPAIGFANASRLPQVPLLVRPDEIERGYIDHMLGIVIPKNLGAGYVWPARAGDGSGADGVPMGMVFRLREDIDLSGYTASTQAVLRALQVHGAVVFDSGASGGDGIKLAGMSNGWEGTDLRQMQRELSSIPVQWFEAVDVVGLAADPTVGWYVTTV
ncbi:Ig-like domain-containing protein [Mycobacterium sp. SMC-4]|uniref:Ig-like domain-containing protein n=1 Tax=Mycobacterium sp. SMC-4 TaxID=2857059 RepID=UPI0021B3FA44|nr:Ig-like domain-containing protein [Mycobacterium sp. SMC-4]UXA16010.1 VCBS domain-containing protein [Mycobacterium sp. SMC-4]